MNNKLIKVIILVVSAGAVHSLLGSMSPQRSVLLEQAQDILVLEKDASGANGSGVHRPKLTVANSLALESGTSLPQEVIEDLSAITLANDKPPKDLDFFDVLEAPAMKSQELPAAERAMFDKM
jgi:hypothetical protein